MRILVLSDVHIGAIKDTAYVYNTITDIFDKELKFNKTDAVIFTGDFFHRLLKTNEEFTSLAINIVSYLVKLSKDIKIRFIYGTESHECGSYRLFNYHLNNDHVDLKVITTVTEEELFPNINVLYIPEEYVDSKEDHYKEYFDKRYDYIFGHGVIIEGMPMVKYGEVKTSERKVPSFRSEELSKICTLCLFGHYHVHTKVCDNVYYVGSLFRQSFGEEEAKGYCVIENNKVIFVENEAAYLYKTYTYEKDSSIYENTDKLIEEIKRIKEENDKLFNNEEEGKLRLVFSLPEDIDDSYKEAIRTLLFNDKKISPLIKETSEVISSVQDEVSEEYDFILDNSMKVEEKVHRYITKTYETNLSLNEIKKYIHDELEI